MIVRSRIITLDSIRRAVDSVPGDVQFQNVGHVEGWFYPWRQFTGRDGRPAFEFFLSGSSPHRAQHDREEFAATWTEWGIVIAYLFEVDPDAKIGHYDGRDEFRRLTAAHRAGLPTPWLEAA